MKQKPKDGYCNVYPYFFDSKGFFQNYDADAFIKKWVKRGVFSVKEFKHEKSFKFQYYVRLGINPDAVYEDNETTADS